MGAQVGPALPWGGHQQQRAKRGRSAARRCRSARARDRLVPNANAPRAPRATLRAVAAAPAISALHIGGRRSHSGRAGCRAAGDDRSSFIRHAARRARTRATATMPNCVRAADAGSRGRTRGRTFTSSSSAARARTCAASCATSELAAGRCGACATRLARQRRPLPPSTAALQRRAPRVTAAYAQGDILLRDCIARCAKGAPRASWSVSCRPTPACCAAGRTPCCAGTARRAVDEPPVARCAAGDAAGQPQEARLVGAGRSCPRSPQAGREDVLLLNDLLRLERRMAPRSLRCPRRGCDQPRAPLLRCGARPAASGQGMSMPPLTRTRSHAGPWRKARLARGGGPRFELAPAGGRLPPLPPRRRAPRAG